MVGFKFGRVILVNHVTLRWLEPHPVSEDAALGYILEYIWSFFEMRT